MLEAHVGNSIKILASNRWTNPLGHPLAGQSQSILPRCRCQETSVRSLGSARRLRFIHPLHKGAARPQHHDDQGNDEESGHRWEMVKC
jgi:hypothetical protein